MRTSCSVRCPSLVVPAGHIWRRRRRRKSCCLVEWFAFGAQRCRSWQVDAHVGSQMRFVKFSDPGTSRATHIPMQSALEPLCCSGYPQRQRFRRLIHDDGAPSPKTNTSDQARGCGACGDSIIQSDNQVSLCSLRVRCVLRHGSPPFNGVRATFLRCSNNTVTRGRCSGFKHPRGVSRPRLGPKMVIGRQGLRGLAIHSILRIRTR